MGHDPLIQVIPGSWCINGVPDLGTPTLELCSLFYTLRVEHCRLSINAIPLPRSQWQRPPTQYTYPLPALVPHNECELPSNSQRCCYPLPPPHSCIGCIIMLYIGKKIYVYTHTPRFLPGAGWEDLVENEWGQGERFRRTMHSKNRDSTTRTGSNSPRSAAPSLSPRWIKTARARRTRWHCRRPSLWGSWFELYSETHLHPCVLMLFPSLDFAFVASSSRGWCSRRCGISSNQNLCEQEWVQLSAKACLNCHRGQQP